MVEQSPELKQWVDEIREDYKRHTVRVLLVLSQDIAEKIDKKRGNKSRNSFIVDEIIKKM